MSNKYIQSVAWLNKQTLIYSYWGGEIYLRDVVTGVPDNHLLSDKHDHAGFFLLLNSNNAQSLVTYTNDHKLQYASLTDCKFQVLCQASMPISLGPPTAGLWSKSDPDCIYLGHDNNKFSIWKITTSGLERDPRSDLFSYGLKSSFREHLPLRSLQESADGKIFIAGEQGIISLVDPSTKDPSTKKVLLQSDYNLAARMGMNDICYVAEHQLLFGTCCIASCEEAQLYVWRVNQVEGNYSLKRICKQHFPAKDQSFYYANRCRVLNFDGKMYLLLSLSDGSVRVAKLEILTDSINLDWIKIISLEAKGGAEFVCSPDGQHIAFGIQKMHLRTISELTVGCR